MKANTLLASLAVAGLALAQPAAAATRSAESLPDSGVRADRTASPLAEAEAVRGSPMVMILLVFGVLAVVLLALGGGSSTGGPVQSPG